MTLLLVDSHLGRKVFCLGGQNTKSASAADSNTASELGGNLTGRDIVAISCGDFHGAAIDSTGCLYTWGGGKSTQHNRGQCGHGSTAFCEQPKQVLAFMDKRVQRVVCGAMHTLVLTEDK